MYKFILYSLTMLAATSGPAALYDHLDVPYTATPITIDGNLEPAWDRALPYNLGACDGTINNLIVEHYLTVVRLLWNEKYLYVSFVCSGHEIIAPMTQRDQPVYQHDCCEVFLRLNAKTMVEIVVSPHNVVYDARSFRNDLNTMTVDIGYNVAGLQTATKIIAVDKGRLVWRVEMAIPWAGLGLDPGKQDCLDGNFLRYETMTSESRQKQNGPLKAYLPLSLFPTGVPGWPSGTSSHGKIQLRHQDMAPQEKANQP